MPGKRLTIPRISTALPEAASTITYALTGGYKKRTVAVYLQPPVGWRLGTDLAGWAGLRRCLDRGRLLRNLERGEGVVIDRRHDRAFDDRLLVTTHDRVGLFAGAAFVYHHRDATFGQAEVLDTGFELSVHH